ncbi:MAG: hypothetical protein OXU38_11450 [Gemmatimonadota bacterium]|nr:hypothetical protein [Gemmatimonadota bacterium]
MKRRTVVSVGVQLTLPSSVPGRRYRMSAVPTNCTSARPFGSEQPQPDRVRADTSGIPSEFFA